jgi:hypothetical protein
MLWFRPIKPTYMELKESSSTLIRRITPWMEKILRSILMTGGCQIQEHKGGQYFLEVATLSLQGILRQVCF